MKRFVCALALLVLAAGCDSGSGPSAERGQPHLRARGSSNSTAVRQGDVHAQTLCHDTFGRRAIESVATTVGAVRASGIGLLGGVFASAFRGSRDAEFAAWCMIETAPHCYDESAVATDGGRVHIAEAGCGWPPRAGPAYWTL